MGAIVKGKRVRPRKILLYGEHGVGKSTWANQSPKPIFIDVEGGLDDIDCDRTMRIRDWGQLYAECLFFAEGQHDYRTICIDTLDWAESLLHKSIVDRASGDKIKSISDGPLAYGRGHEQAAAEFHKLLTVLDAAIRNMRGVILLGHAKVERVEDPGMPAYTRYNIDVHKSIAGCVCEWADEVLFCNTRIYSTKEDAGFNKTRTVAVGGTERFIRTSHSAAATAKNRLNLPDELPMEWSAYSKYIGAHYATATPAAVPIETQPAPLGDGANIGGVVVDGSSKVKELVNG